MSPVSNAPGPTRGAQEADDRWTGSPRLARALRVAVFVAPLLTSWIAIAMLGSSFWRPDGLVGLAVWIGQAIAVAIVVSRLTELATRRLIPLASLLSLTLVFPDQAPSRFGVALRQGTVKQLSKRIETLETEGLGADANSAAHAAIELVGMLGAHDPLTRGHTERVRAYADLIAAEMGIDQAGRDRLAWSVMLHDVGKLVVPPEILNKTDKLTDDEWEILKSHPARGQAMLAPLSEWLGEWDAAAGEHHERWDGTGYPLGLAGEEISLAGRIAAVADAYDVITSTRSYKKPMSADAARRELVRCSGAQFDPAVVRAMLAASLGNRRNAGPFAWLTEIPRLLDAVTKAALSPTAAVVPVVAAVAVGTAGVGLPAPSVEVAAELPFASATTASTAPPTTARQLMAPPLAPTTAVTTVSPTTGGETEPTETPTTEPVLTTAPTSAPTTTPTTPTSPPTTATGPTTTENSTSTTVATTTTTTQPTTTTTVATTTTTASTTTTTEPPPMGPFTTDDDVSAEEGKDEKIQVLENDTDNLGPIDQSSLSIVTEPQHAQSFRVHESGGTFHLHYKSVDNYTGPDTIVYEVCDTSNRCSTGTVNITVFED